MSATALSDAEKRRLVRLWNARVPMKHRDIAAVMGVSRSRVWQIEHEALIKIRKAMEART